MNAHERQLEEMRMIRRRWADSEFRINFLRAFTGQPLNEPTDDQLRQWDQAIRQQCSIWQIPPIS